MVMGSAGISPLVVDFTQGFGITYSIPSGDSIGGQFFGQDWTMGMTRCEPLCTWLDVNTDHFSGSWLNYSIVLHLPLWLITTPSLGPGTASDGSDAVVHSISSRGGSATGCGSLLSIAITLAVDTSTDLDSGGCTGNSVTGIIYWPAAFTCMGTAASPPKRRSSSLASPSQQPEFS